MVKKWSFVKWLISSVSRIRIVELQMLFDTKYEVASQQLIHAFLRYLKVAARNPRNGGRSSNLRFSNFQFISPTNNPMVSPETISRHQMRQLDGH